MVSPMESVHCITNAYKSVGCHFTIICISSPNALLSPPHQVTRRSNEKLYLKYLSTTSVSAAMAEQQPSAVQTRKQQQREGGGGGGGGGGRQLLHGAKVDFDMWKAKVDESNQR